MEIESEILHLKHAFASLGSRTPVERQQVPHALPLRVLPLRFLRPLAHHLR